MSSNDCDVAFMWIQILQRGVLLYSQMQDFFLGFGRSSSIFANVLAF